MERNWSSGFFILILYTLSSVHITKGWETPSPHQYHIQTDEGPERYFRYQTDSGQYRKEKRLEDGTVIGSYAWIDGDGILRQRDYIADNAGYRILKNKNVFVGRNVNIGEAVKAIKKYPANAGTLVKSNQKPIRPVITVPYSTPLPATTYFPSSSYSTTPIVSSTPRPYVDYSTQNNIISTTSRPYVSSTNPIVATTPGRIVVTSTETPIIEITPNAYPKNFFSTSVPSLLLEVPRNHTDISENYLPVTTERPYYHSTVPPTQYATTERPYYHSTVPPTRYVPTPEVQYIPSSETGYNAPQIYSKEVDQNSLDYPNPFVRQVDNSYRFHNGPTYPLDQNGKPFIGNGYDPQNSKYDGVSITNDGFRYYIPRAYHEEETSGDKRSGSFGYIDPFGIRRVIYYNTAPGTGFQHKKNNRYVGFDATPYDPRPY